MIETSNICGVTESAKEIVQSLEGANRKKESLSNDLNNPVIDVSQTLVRSTVDITPVLIHQSQPSVTRNSLGQLQKGSINNPKGRPAGKRNLTTILETYLKRMSRRKGITYGELMVEKLVKRAADKEHFDSQKLILAYTDGLPTQRVEVSEQMYIIDDDKDDNDEQY